MERVADMLKLLMLLSVCCSGAVGAQAQDIPDTPEGSLPRNPKCHIAVMWHGLLPRDILQQSKYTPLLQKPKKLSVRPKSLFLEEVKDIFRDFHTGVYALGLEQGCTFELFGHTWSESAGHVYFNDLGSQYDPVQDAGFGGLSRNSSERGSQLVTILEEGARAIFASSAVKSPPMHFTATPPGAEMRTRAQAQAQARPPPRPNTEANSHAYLLHRSIDMAFKLMHGIKRGRAGAVPAGQLAELGTETSAASAASARSEEFTFALMMRWDTVFLTPFDTSILNPDLFYVANWCRATRGDLPVVASDDGRYCRGLSRFYLDAKGMPDFYFAGHPRVLETVFSDLFAQVEASSDFKALRDHGSYNHLLMSWGARKKSTALPVKIGRYKYHHMDVDFRRSLKCQFRERLNDTVSNPIMRKLGVFGRSQPDGMYNAHDEHDESVCPVETQFCVGQYALTTCLAFLPKP